MSPIYLALASILGVPGVKFHLRCVAIGARLLLTGRASMGSWTRYLFFPMDSTRYFEFDEVWNRVKKIPFTSYLDVSSPRLLPLLVMRSKPKATVMLVNPDVADLKETMSLARALDLESRCTFFNGVLDAVEDTTPSFDLITCISVLEHIPEDKAAIERMWSLLRPGGKLILTLPCMSHPLEQRISHNQYGVLASGDDGYTFWQRYYDQVRLQTSIYSVTGVPCYAAVYGEKVNGLFFRNTSMKRLLGFLYPFWREPYMMATEYQYYSNTDELPGEGVIMLEFLKGQ